MYTQVRNCVHMDTSSLVARVAPRDILINTRSVRVTGAFFVLPIGNVTCRLYAALFSYCHWRRASGIQQGRSRLVDTRTPIYETHSCVIIRSILLSSV